MRIRVRRVSTRLAVCWFGCGAGQGHKSTLLGTEVNFVVFTTQKTWLVGLTRAPFVGV
jgi:hypothetical protein